MTHMTMKLRKKLNSRENWRLPGRNINRLLLMNVSLASITGRPCVQPLSKEGLCACPKRKTQKNYTNKLYS